MVSWGNVVPFEKSTLPEVSSKTPDGRVRTLPLEGGSPQFSGAAPRGTGFGADSRSEGGYNKEQFWIPGIVLCGKDQEGAGLFKDELWKHLGSGRS